MRAAVAACRGCACCGRIPGNAWRRSYCPPPNRSSRSANHRPAFERYGAPLAAAPPGRPRSPSIPGRLALATEAELRACRWISAPHLLATARMIASGQFDLAA